MRTELLMVTYGKDAEWCELSLRSIQKFGTGFTGVTVVVPVEDVRVFEPFIERYGIRLREYHEVAGKGFLGHMIQKCYADVWCPAGTELVAHIDADCIFGEPFCPEDFVAWGKPVLVREHYGDMVDYESRYSWRVCTQQALGFDCEWETMVRHPGVFRVQEYRTLRRLVEARHGCPFTDYVYRGRNEFPQQFAEFPALGAVALKEAGDQYEVVTAIHTPGSHWDGNKWGLALAKPGERKGSDCGRADYFLWKPAGDEPVLMLGSMFKNPVRYYWSKEGVTEKQRAEIEALLGVKKDSSC